MLSFSILINAYNYSDTYNYKKDSDYILPSIIQNHLTLLCDSVTASL